MRSVKHGRRKARRRINYSKTLVAAKKKAMKKRKAMNGITCKQMRIAWNKNATVKQNMKAMGLAYDSNKLFPLRRDISMHCEEMEIDEPKMCGSVKSQVLKTELCGRKLNNAKVIEALQKEAEEEEIKQKKGRSYRLQDRDIEFCVHMIVRHGDNYEAMSCDARNIYQDTAKQIQRKIRIFKQSPEYPKYLKAMSHIS